MINGAFWVYGGVVRTFTPRGPILLYLFIFINFMNRLFMIFIKLFQNKKSYDIKFKLDGVLLKVKVCCWNWQNNMADLC